MKKLMTVLMTLTLVFGLSGIAMAEVCDNCKFTCDEPGAINRGCDVLQDTCDIFDYDGWWECVNPPMVDDWGPYPYGYCTGKNESPDHQAFINICTCADEDLFTDTPAEGDTIDISMEILVDKNDGEGKDTGENGVYWAENVNSICLKIYEKDAPKCSGSADIITTFDGDLIYKLADGSEACSDWSYDENCQIEDDCKAVKIVTDVEDDDGDHGYTIGQWNWRTGDYDPVQNMCWYSPNIPSLFANSSEVEAGWKVYVRVCLTYTSEDQGVCPIDCCVDVYIGSLCCGTDFDIVYPYVPNLDLTDPLNTWWTGLVITNITSDTGKALITLYESDGDVGVWNYASVPAMGNKVTANTELMANLVKTSGTGVLGDSDGYIIVSPTFPATGFCMSGNTTTGKAMGNGYLPQPMWMLSPWYYFEEYPISGF